MNIINIYIVIVSFVRTIFIYTFYKCYIVHVFILQRKIFNVKISHIFAGAKIMEMYISIDIIVAFNVNFVSLFMYFVLK